MSILLDSLRKSEAQRNVGDAPTIYSTQDYGGSDDSNKRWITWLLLGVAAVAITWYGWQQYSFPGEEETLAETQAGQPSSPGEAPSPRTVQEPARQSGAEPETRTPVEQLAGASESAGESTDMSEMDGSPLDRIAAFEAEQAAVLTADNEERADQNTEPPENLATLAEQDLSNEGRTAQQEIPDRPLRSRTTTQTDSPEDDVMSYWQLPQGLRNELPEFKITVLVYAEVPEDRFLLMDGERYREEDELDGGATLEEIRRDGAVFSYQTWRFLVKN